MSALQGCLGQTKISVLSCPVQRLSKDMEQAGGDVAGCQGGAAPIGIAGQLKARFKVLVHEEPR